MAGSAAVPVARTRSVVAASSRDAHYLWTAVATSATVVVGFAFTYFAPMLTGTYAAVSPAVHLHGWTFFLWYLLFPLQAGLMRTRRVQLHRTLGTLSLGLASAMVATGTLVIGARMAEAVASAEPSFWSFFGPMIFATLMLFAGFYAAAFALRRRGAWHKRLMVVASAVGCGAAAFRIVVAAFGQVMWAAPLGIFATNLFIMWGMLHDKRREGQVHAVYWAGLLVCVAVEAGVLLLTPTSVGWLLAHGLAWVGRTFAFLY